MEREELEKLLQSILASHVGEANAIARWDLVIKVFGQGADIPRTDDNRADRAIRKAVEGLRNQGRIICNLGNGAGWFMPSNDEEYRAFRSSYGSHAFPIMANIRAMDETAREIWPNALQPRLFS